MGRAAVWGSQAVSRNGEISTTAIEEGQHSRSSYSKRAEPQAFTRSSRMGKATRASSLEHGIGSAPAFSLLRQLALTITPVQALASLTTFSTGCHILMRFV